MPPPVHRGSGPQIEICLDGEAVVLKGLLFVSTRRIGNIRPTTACLIKTTGPTRVRVQAPLLAHQFSQPAQCRCCTWFQAGLALSMLSYIIK